ncbi:MAG: DNA helicase RecG, partial [Sporomusaceae bacterium]|nr:DNA helicase RecG [Sporomusaceae bacterium]
MISVLEWSSSIQYIKGVGPAKAAQLGKLGIFTIGQLLEYFPVRYEDRSQLKQISELSPGNVEAFRGKVLTVTERKVRRGLSLLSVVVVDSTGSVELVWFNQPFLKKRFTVDALVSVYGKIERHYTLKVTNPETEIISETDLFHGRILPVYRLGEHIPQTLIRSLIEKFLLTEFYIPEVLPERVLRLQGLMGRKEAFHMIHY